MPNALYQSGVTCGQVSCDTLAGHGDCLMELSISFLKCVNTTTGLVKEFCKKSCNNCGKGLKDQDTSKSTFYISTFSDFSGFYIAALIFLTFQDVINRIG